jgi:hypothetical protein
MRLNSGNGIARLSSMKPERWQPVRTPGLIGFGVGYAIFLGLVLASERGFVPVIDHANLLFHEAGHPIVGLFSSRLEPYGGTLGQLVFPVVLAVSFWRKGQVLSFAGALLWFFENWFNVARYMADARAMELPLVGGGDHDWNTILSRWNLLPHDTGIAGSIQALAWVGVALVLIWVLWRAWQDRKLGRTAVGVDEFQFQNQR